MSYLKFSDVEEARMKCQGGIFYLPEVGPVIIREINGRFQASVNKLGSDDIDTVPLSSILASTVDLGFMNRGIGSFYLLRRPARRPNQGLTDNNLSVYSAIPGGGAGKKDWISPYLLPSPTLRRLRDEGRYGDLKTVIEGDYPTFEEVYNGLVSGSLYSATRGSFQLPVQAMAFDRNFALVVESNLSEILKKANEYEGTSALKKFLKDYEVREIGLVYKFYGKQGTVDSGRILMDGKNVSVSNLLEEMSDVKFQ